MGNLLLRRRSEPGLIGWPAVSLIGTAFAITMLGATLPTRPGAPVRDVAEHSVLATGEGPGS
jgi:hypothetical protein